MATKDEDQLMDLLEGRRKFEFSPSGSDEKIVYYLAMPSSDVIQQADWEYAKVYNKALVEGIFTQSEMRDLLLKRNIIGPQYDSDGQRLNEEITALLVRLELEKDDDNRRILATEVAKKRNEVFSWNQRLNGPMASTCEQIAEDAKVEYLTIGIVQNEDGSRVWETLEEYKNEKNFEFKVQVKLEVMLWMEGLDSDVLKNIPEQKVLAELDEKDLAKEDSKEDSKEDTVETEEVSQDEPKISKKKVSKKKKKSASK